jgi:hypothetical protein
VLYGGEGLLLDGYHFFLIIFVGFGFQNRF